MSLIAEAKRAQFGQSLLSFQTQATNAINQLKGIKQNLLNLKATIQSDPDFTASDASEVDEVITKIENTITQEYTDADLG